MRSLAQADAPVVLIDVVHPKLAKLRARRGVEQRHDADEGLVDARHLQRSTVERGVVVRPPSGCLRPGLAITGGSDRVGSTSRILALRAQAKNWRDALKRRRLLRG